MNGMPEGSSINASAHVHCHNQTHGLKNFYLLKFFNFNRVLVVVLINVFMHIYGFFILKKFTIIFIVCFPLFKYPINWFSISVPY